MDRPADAEAGKELKCSQNHHLWEMSKLKTSGGGADTGGTFVFIFLHKPLGRHCIFRACVVPTSGITSADQHRYGC